MNKDIQLLNDTQSSALQVATGYSKEKLHVVQSSVAKNTSPVELAYFLEVCKSSDLSPFLKEIWCYKDKKGNLIIMAGRDGFRKNAQRHPDFGGIISSVVRTDDKFHADLPNSRITHEVDAWSMNRGEIVGAYCIVSRKGCSDTVALADFSRYRKDFGAYSPWKTHPEAMIEKVAEVLALKKAFGLSGVQAENDFEVDNDIVKPIDHEFVDRTKEQLQIAQDKKKSEIDEIRAEAQTMLKNIKDDGFRKDMFLQLKNNYSLTTANSIANAISNKLDEELSDEVTDKEYETNE